jgi:hypothetical protein
MVSLVANSQLPSHLNLQEIQKEFMILYYKRCDSLGHKIVEDKSLICLTECQVNYLKDFEHMSHKQEVGSKFYSLVDRYTVFYPEMLKTSGVNLEMSEVISLVGVGKTLSKQTNKGLAKKLFNNFLESDSHREIMDDKKLIKVNFQVGLNKYNSIYIVGVLSNQTLK